MFDSALQPVNVAPRRSVRATPVETLDLGLVDGGARRHAPSADGTVLEQVLTRVVRRWSGMVCTISLSMGLRL
jgi:hypothetical protein